MDKRRAREEARETGLRAGIALYGQALCGLCLFLTEYALSPAWLCMLIALPFFLLCRFLAARAVSRPGRTALLTAALIAFFDALAAYAALCALCQTLLPALPSWLAAALPALFAAWAARGDGRALTILSRPAALLIACPLLYCALAALPQADVGRLFPLLGRGADALGLGALWACGCAAGATLHFCFPRPGPDAPQPPLFPAAAAWMLAVATAALRAALMPYPALAQGMTQTDKLLLIGRFSSPAAGWPLMMAALLTLLLYALVSALNAAAARLTAAAKRPAPGFLLCALLMGFLLPAGAHPTRIVTRILTLLLPFRAALTLGILAALFIKNKRAKGAAADAQ